MATAVDVNDVPDIIEAQLTLSYSRLTELMKAIMGRSNEHDDLLLSLRDTVTQLQQENATLRGQMAALTVHHAAVESNSGGLAGSIAEVQRGLAELTEGGAAQQRRLAAVEAAVAQSQDTHGALQGTADALAGRLDALQQQQQAAAPQLETAAALTELWGTTPDAIRAQAAQDADGRCRFLLALPAFRDVGERVAALQQQHEALQAAAAEERDAARSTRAATEQLQQTAGELQQRLSALEAGEAPGAAKGSVHERLALLEGRLRNLLAGGERGHAGEGLAVTDVAYRVSLIEETVEGLSVRGAGGGGSARADSPPPDHAPTQRPAGRASLPPLPGARRLSGRRMEQPVLESLRRDGNDYGAVSVTVLPEDGLRRRLAQTEENVAVLEVHKAERQELAALEAVLRASLKPHGIALLSDDADGGAERGGGDKKPTGTSAGRPVFMPGSAVFLKSGATETNATALYSNTR
ncbi:hypothetical protein STCU_09023 [Strigomonas culicis]|uniref:Uncharacterized protein n=1 Tax=Strigomonas culicis TaxID=28005 RepID=S9TPW4_9TRYP|nr:hypothetical protein STCU_09023 [Strigomonas culicis]|eukprot:EPY20377.1 hypothetical protein STCU_09023 [Strigomonas culicis]